MTGPADLADASAPAARRVPQERLGRALWPSLVGWLLLLWIGRDGLLDLGRLWAGRPPEGLFAMLLAGLLPGLSTLPPLLALPLAVGQVALASMALPSLGEWATGRKILAVGERGLTVERWGRWRHAAWEEVERLEFRGGDALFHLRSARPLRVRPWTLGLDAEAFRALIERHQPRLTPDEDEGQPWARSSFWRG